MRVAVTLLIVVLSGLAARALPEDIFSPNLETLRPDADESLLYVVTPEQPVDFVLPPGTMEIRLDVIAVVEMVTPYRPETQYPFEFDATVAGERGAPAQEWGIRTTSRISLEHPDDPDSGQRATLRRAADSRMGTDNRTFRFIVPEAVRERGGKLRIRTREGIADRLLLRPFGQRPQLSNLERWEDLEGDDSGARWARRVGTGLGIDDVATPDEDLTETPDRARWTTWRLEPQGELNEDYRLERVMLSPYRRSAVAPTGEERPYALTEPGRKLAFNLRGPVRVELRGPAGARVHVEGANDADEGHTVQLDTEGRAPLEVAAGPRSVVVEAERAAQVGLELPVREALRLLGEYPNFAMPHGGRARVWPDRRRVVHHDLRADAAVRYRIEPEQDHLRLSFRAALPHPGAAATRVRVQIRRVMKSGEEIIETLKLTPPASHFEHWLDGRMATREAAVLLRLDDNTEFVDVLGPPDVRVRGQVRAPHVDDDILTVPYRNDLGGELGWRFAPKEQRTWIGLLPVNDDELAQEERRPRLVGIVRLRRVPAEPPVAPTRDLRWIREVTSPTRGNAPGGVERVRSSRYARLTLEGEAIGTFQVVENLPDRFQRWRPRARRLLTALGSPLSQRVVRRREGARAGTGRINVSGGARIWVTDTTGPAHDLLLSADPNELGAEAEVWVDGHLVRTVRMSARTLRIAVPLAGGAHDVDVRGLGPGGWAHSSGARPGEGETMHTVRYQRLGPGGTLRFEFDAVEGERQQVRLQILTRTPGRRYIFTVRGGGRGEGDGGLVGSPTRNGQTREDEEHFFLDLGERAPVGSAAARVAFERTPVATRRWVELGGLRGDAGEIWVRAVLYGERSAPSVSGPRSRVRDGSGSALMRGDRAEVEGDSP